MASPGRFVGRAAELTALAGALERAIVGRTSAVLVAGEPGIGKTRLLEEFERLAGARSVPVLWGRATTDEGAPPYWPWRQALRRWMATTDAVTVRDVIGDAARQLGRIVPELGSTAGDGGAVAPDDPQLRFALFEAVGELLQRLAEGEGVVVVLDDLHWADPASLRLLSHVARNVRDARLLLAAAFRPVEAAQSPTAAEAIATLVGEAGTIRLDLGGLGPEDVASQLTPVLGTRPDPATVAAIAERTAGNPLFVQEVGRLLAAGGDGVPDAVRTAIGRRLAMLATDTLRCLQAAAVVGVDIDLAQVAALTGRAMEAVMGSFDEALAAGLVSPRRSATGYRFAHDLIRECCLLELATSDRANLHLAAAAALEAAGADRAAEIAHHRHAALPMGDPVAARDAAARGAEQAVAQLAYEDAARFYRWAIDAAETAATDPALRARLYADAARAHHHSHDGAAAMASAETAVLLAQQLGDAGTIARAVLALEDTSEPEWLTKVTTWCTAALGLLGESDGPIRARLLAQQAVALMLSGDLDGMRLASLEALDAAERCGDSEATATALRARQLAASWPDGAAERLRLGDRMLELGAATADPRTSSWGHIWRFDALVQLGRIDEADAELTRLEPVVASARQPLTRFHLLRSRAAVHAARGRFEAALTTDEEALDLAHQGGYTGAVITSLAFRAWLSVITGRRLVDPDQMPLHQAPPVFAAITRTFLAELHLAFGELDEVARLYGEIQAAPRPPLPFLQVTFDASLAQLAAALGDGPAAEAAYRSLLPYADLHVTGGAGAIITRGSVQHHLGVAAAGAGRRDDAVDHLRVAVEANADAGLPPSVVESQCVLAETLAARARPGDPAEARAMALAGRAGAEQLGMTPLRRRADEALGRIGPVADPLSRREHEVADLVARGMTNRQVAAALHIAERTAENHVQHVLTKLGFTSRSQIAAWVVSSRR